VSVEPADLQYIYCSVCLELHEALEAAGEQPKVAITITRGEAVCEDHRRRVDGFTSAVLGAKRFLERQNGGGPRGGLRRY
jgi:hypothetical protein